MNDQQPAYRHAYIASCPRCFGGLVDEGFAWWCTTCRQSFSFTEVVLYDDGDKINDD